MLDAANARKGKALYLDCQAGIAGDMLVAALIDLAEDPVEAEAAVRAALESLPADGFSIEVSRVSKAGIACRDFNVILDEAHENHDHDMDYLHGHGGEHECGRGRYHEHEDACCHEHAHGDDCCHGHHYDHGHHRHADRDHDHDHDHDRDHDHGHDHDHHRHHGHAHAHRGLVDVLALIDAAEITDAARAYARKAFQILAEAESKAHAVSLDQVHFHEVGAIDSVVDVLAAAVLVDYLGVGRCIVPVLMDGHGAIRCQHGIIPVPAPATLNICMAHGLPLGSCDVEGELVTPTGAALVAALDPEFALPATYRVLRAGSGAGKRTYSRPSIVRALLIEPLEAAARVEPASTCPAPLSEETDAPERVVKLECDVDDATGEQLAYAADRLLTAGAREVHWLPIFAKKGRPAYQLQVVCLGEEVERMERIIFAETTTTGVRRSMWERTVLPRELKTVATPYGDIRVKRVTLSDGGVRVKPEYDDCSAAAKRAGVPLQHVISAALGVTAEH